MPPELAVELGRLRLKSPVLCGSGEHVMDEDGIRAALRAGAAAVVAKSANESEAARRQLASADYRLLGPGWAARPLGPPGDASLFNRSGLVDRPFGEWLELLAACECEARELDAFVAASLIPADSGELPRLAHQVERAGLRWLELNLSAPHAGEARPGAIASAATPAQVGELTASVRRVVRLHLTVKLTGESADVLGLVAAAREAGADSITLLGRQLGFLPDLETQAPVLGTFGAIGGPWALPLTLRWVAKARQAFGPALPLIGTNGARSGRDVARFLLAGARAVQLATVPLCEGAAGLRRVADELCAYLSERALAAGDLIGRAADAAMTYEEAAMRSGA